MRFFAIADPHLSRAHPKPMDIFGDHWQGHPELFFQRWREHVHEDDVVLIPGDISWAMKLEQALLDLQDIADLPGKKVLLRGNHDYWWTSVSKVRRALPEGMYALQHDALQFGDVVITGTRAWECPGSLRFDEDDAKIYHRELERLKLALRAADALSGRVRIVMLHFPPMNALLEPSGFSELLLEYRPDIIVFGHVHGETEQSRRRVPQSLGDSVLHFVAADALQFTPKLILDTDAVASFLPLQH